ncbi:MAG: 4-phosphoerythronate dehydrogenase [Halofilum sp. (in: g-proteobacteria)]|nr:4-phosphoerythronate dehydrogenase [Halofilum sp. (in: g-proteobacteria)]
MRLVVDENLAAAEAALAPLGEVVRRPGRAIGPADVAAADALFVRSVTPVGPELLAGSPVRFVGSATIGIDHVDTDWLAAQGIGFASAPGCNAAAVADWVVAVLAALAAEGRHCFGHGSAGVIGVGNVGLRVAARLRALGYRVRPCDPPRAAAEGSAGFVDPATALASDVVTLHVPLTDAGAHPTRGLVDATALAAMPAGAVLLNSARGGVVDEDALASRLDDGPDLHAVLDTWAGEPAIDAGLLARTALGTPHIAGYSLEGRLRGTAMVAAAAAAFFGVTSDWDWRAELPPAPALAPASDPLATILGAYDPRRDDAALRGLLRCPGPERPAAFDALRRGYPMRREFGYHPCVDPPAALRAAGFGAPEGLPGDALAD